MVEPEIGTKKAKGSSIPMDFSMISSSHFGAISLNPELTVSWDVAGGTLQDFWQLSTNVNWTHDEQVESPTQGN